MRTLFNKTSFLPVAGILKVPIIKNIEIKQITSTAIPIRSHDRFDKDNQAH
ncbi:hypothetical protein [Mucilaginibacter gracilis]|uniref:hypothetical protein n=1 Tax=Mucilaginibacter gracilis TaxID=423350 RepID=UPI0013C2F0EA|nr:hypothetical protein [Mucilaginibacter gracilis]